MPDILTVRYAQTGKSTNQNPLGMREMQARAYEERNAQYLQWIILPDSCS